VKTYSAYNEGACMGTQRLQSCLKYSLYPWSNLCVCMGTKAGVHRRPDLFVDRFNMLILLLPCLCSPSWKETYLQCDVCMQGKKQWFTNICRAALQCWCMSVCMF